MNAADINTKLIDSYLSLLKNMSAQNKLDLVSKLTKTVKTEKEQEWTDFYSAFGGWDETESAEELIEDIKKSRTFNRTIEEF
jgi:4-hydroxyphenylpyruvate dioxygenase-like putative hemolysin